MSESHGPDLVGESSAGRWRLIFAPLGSFRTHLVWRLFGLGVLMIQMILCGGALNLGACVANRPLVYHLHTLAALALVLAGPRLVTIAAVALSCLSFVVPVIFYRVERMLGEEYTFLLVLPCMGLALALVTMMRREHRAELLGRGRISEALQLQLEQGQLSLMRIVLITSLMWAALHKVNSDFFDEDLSCAHVLSGRLVAWWSPPLAELYLPMDPWVVIAGEGLIPLLLPFYPLVGILFTLLFLVPIGSIGPMGFTTLVFAMSFAFLRSEDVPAARAALRRLWVFPAALALPWFFVSGRFYDGTRPFFDFFVFQLMGMSMALLVGACLFSAMRRRLKAGRNLSAHLRPHPFWRDLFPREKTARVVMVAFLIGMLFNGLTPYLGVKYRLSFGMLSNLRADTDRWNHLLLPSSLYLREHDPFIHITKVVIRAEDRKTIRRHKLYGKKGLSKGLVSPMSLKRRLQRHRRRGVTADLELIYLGEELRWTDVAGNEAFRAWLVALPDSKMWQEGLSLSRGQRCVH